MENNKPIKSFKAGAVRASIFANTLDNGHGRNNTMYRVVIDRRYKDRDGNWKSTNGFSKTELPAAIVVMQKAFEYLAMKGEDTAENGRPSEDDIYEG